MKSFTFGIVGSGEISAQTAAAMAATSGCSVRMVMDKNSEAAADLAGKYGARATADMDELLADREIDAVYIATPHFLHADHACRAAEAGKHVFVEKPLALKDKDTARIVRTCRERKVACATMFVNRWSEHAELARKWVQAGTIGRVITVTYTFLQDRRSQYWTQGVSGKARPTDWRGSREKAGGGNLIMNGAHHIDLLLWITGLKVIRASCEMGTYVHPVEVEDMLCATLRFDNGAIASVSTGTAAIGKAPALFTLFGDKGQVDIPDFWGPKVRLFTLKTDTPFAAEQWHDLPADTSRNTRQAMVQATVEAIREGRPVPADGEAGAESQRVINMIYASAV
ncbi:MAG: Gfo/Idh/MocA family oxidoreductase [Fibrobacterota bacterium]